MIKSVVGNGKEEYGAGMNTALCGMTVISPSIVRNQQSEKFHTGKSLLDELKTGSKGCPTFPVPGGP